MNHSFQSSNRFDHLPGDNYVVAVSDGDSIATNDNVAGDSCRRDQSHLQPSGDDEETHYESHRLPSEYAPSDSDVVCARGKAYWDHEGNRRYRLLIAQATQKYSTSNNKLEKTRIVSEIVEAVRKSKGKFVKKVKARGPWVQVDDVFAREKVGQSLRDGLGGKYRSAAKSKLHRRNEAKERFNGDIDLVVHSNPLVSRRINQLSQHVKKDGELASDYSIVTLFSRVNADILETIKNDASMLVQFQGASNAANIL